MSKEKKVNKKKLATKTNLDRAYEMDYDNNNNTDFDNFWFLRNLIDGVADEDDQLYGGI